MNKGLISLLAGVGGIIGGYIPVIFGAGGLSGWSIIGGLAGGIVGIYIAVKIMQ